MIRRAEGEAYRGVCPLPENNPTILPELRSFVIMGHPVLDFLFRGYKRGVSPVLHAVGVSRCIFLPTCSEYAYLAISKYGFVRGAGMALRRIGRCHPLGKGGFDPVP